VPVDTSEPALAAFWTEYADGDRRGAAFVLRHPVRLWRAFRGVRALPVIEAGPSASAGGAAVRRTLTHPGPLGLPARLMGTAVLAVPADPQEHVTGRSAQTLRRKIRSAEKLGVVVRPVSDPEERERLLKLADDTERTHPDAAYRVADPDNQDLLDHDLWLVADDADGDPLLLSVTPVDGDLATLRYFRTLGSGPAHSDSRYLMTHALVAELSAQGVRWLLDTDPPGMQKNGLRHFQRMVGFRYARIRLLRTRRVVAAVAVPAAVAAEPYLERASVLAAL
jgi:hypothetical protein